MQNDIVLNKGHVVQLLRLWARKTSTLAYFLELSQTSIMEYNKKIVNDFKQLTIILTKNYILDKLTDFWIRVCEWYPVKVTLNYKQRYASS